MTDAFFFKKADFLGYFFLGGAQTKYPKKCRELGPMG
jgi:hypothetical protein